MGRFRNIFSGEHRTFRFFVAISTVAFVVIWIVGPGNTWIHRAKAGIEINRQEKLIERYHQEIEQMDKRINMLKTYKDTLEKFAREQFYFAAPGDDVYLLEED